MTFANFSDPWKRSALLTTLTACVLAGACTAAQAAAACTESASAGSPEAPAIRVSFRDLDLATDRGAHTLYERINAAARKVCEVSNVRNLDEVAAGQACERAAVLRAVHQVHSGRLAALYGESAPRG